jgi:hypothetical protein
MVCRNVEEGVAWSIENHCLLTVSQAPTNVALITLRAVDLAERAR